MCKTLCGKCVWYFDNEMGCIGRTFQCQPEKVKNIVAACSLLHNFLLNKTPDTYIPAEFRNLRSARGPYVQAVWRRNSASSQPTASPYCGRQLDDAKAVRDTLKPFLNSQVGSVRFQNRAARVSI